MPRTLRPDPTSAVNTLSLPHISPAPGALREADIETLARTLWALQAAEQPMLLAAMAMAILNRFQRQAGEGKILRLKEFCTAPWHYEVWNPDHPQHKAMQNIGMEEPLFRLCLQIARRAVTLQLTDMTGGATHFLFPGQKAAWAVGRTPCYQQEGIMFFSL
jgi:N-acetylmuramoyl-L-alanine amidase